MDGFNRVFQKSTENTTSYLYIETSRLVRKYAANLLTTAAIVSVGDNLMDLKFDDFLEKEHIGIGSWICISALEQEHDTKPFFDAVKNFYISTLKR